MSVSKVLSILAGCFLCLGFAGTAFAHNSFRLIIAPSYGYAPMPSGHWQCVTYNAWDGSCVQSVWVQNAYAQPVYYGPGPYYYHDRHYYHHRVWG